MLLFHSRTEETPIRIPVYTENVVFQYNSQQFQEHFRMSRETFDRVLGIITPLLQNRHDSGRPTINPTKQFLSVLWLLATPDSYR